MCQSTHVAIMKHLSQFNLQRGEVCSNGSRKSITRLGVSITLSLCGEQPIVKAHGGASSRPALCVRKTEKAGGFPILRLHPNNLRTACETVLPEGHTSGQHCPVAVDQWEV